MALTTDYLPLQEEKKTYLTLATIAGSACFTLIFAATLPWGAYFTLLALGGTLFYTLDHWPNLRATHTSDAALQNDNVLQWIAASAIFLFTLYFLSLSVFSQIVLCCVGSIGLSYYFIDQCIIGSQRLLDRQLCTLVSEISPDLQTIEALLKAGADPFSPDNNGNHAFHHAICARENHAVTLAILNKLREYTNKPILTSKDLLIALKTLGGDSATWHAWWEPTKEALRDPRAVDKRIAFYQVTTLLFQRYTPYLKDFMVHITTYCRQQFCFPKDMSKLSAFYQTPADKINAVFHETPHHPMKAALIAALDGDGQVEVLAFAQQVDLTEEEPPVAPIIVSNLNPSLAEPINNEDLSSHSLSNNRPNT